MSSALGRALLDEYEQRQQQAREDGEAIRTLHHLNYAQAAARRRIEEQARLTAEDAMVAELATRTDIGTVAMVDLHKAKPGWNTIRVCEGCEYQGYEADPIDWPCATIYVLAKAHGIPTPETL